MSKKRRKKYLPFKRTNKQKKTTVTYLLELGTLKGMQQAKEKTTDLLQYHWNNYSELALQRSQIQGELKQALLKNCASNYVFKKWQRTTKWKYSFHPLSTVGSLSYVGGRFNTGSNVNSEVPSFPALYIACDKDTCLQEALGQVVGEDCPLTSRELSLTNPQSEATVSVSGELEKVFDLRSSAHLEEFVELIKDFKISKALKDLAKSLNWPQPSVVQQPEKLLETLLIENWREAPSQYDIPANSQIFGHLIFNAGIEGILYPSKLTGKDCLAIFPRNFAVTSSYIALDDEPPHPNIPQKIDSENWRVCDLSSEEILSTAQQKEDRAT